MERKGYDFIRSVNCVFNAAICLLELLCVFINKEAEKAPWFMASHFIWYAWLLSMRFLITPALWKMFTTVIVPSVSCLGPVKQVRFCTYHNHMSNRPHPPQALPTFIQHSKHRKLHPKSTETLSLARLPNWKTSRLCYDSSSVLTYYKLSSAGSGLMQLASSFWRIALRSLFSFTLKRSGMSCPTIQK